MFHVEGEFGELGWRRADPQREITSHAEEVTRLPARSAITFRTPRKQSSGFAGHGHAGTAERHAKDTMRPVAGKAPSRPRSRPRVALPAVREHFKGRPACNHRMLVPGCAVLRAESSTMTVRAGIAAWRWPCPAKRAASGNRNRIILLCRLG